MRHPEFWWNPEFGIFYPLARGSTACVDQSGSARGRKTGRARMIDTRGRTAREQGSICGNG